MVAVLNTRRGEKVNVPQCGFAEWQLRALHTDSGKTDGTVVLNERFKKITRLFRVILATRHRAISQHNTDIRADSLAKSSEITAVSKIHEQACRDQDSGIQR